MHSICCYYQLLEYVMCMKYEKCMVPWHNMTFNTISTYNIIENITMIILPSISYDVILYYCWYIVIIFCLLQCPSLVWLSSELNFSSRCDVVHLYFPAAALLTLENKPGIGLLLIFCQLLPQMYHQSPKILVHLHCNYCFVSKSSIRRSRPTTRSQAEMPKELKTWKGICLTTTQVKEWECIQCKWGA